LGWTRRGQWTPVLALGIEPNEVGAGIFAREKISDDQEFSENINNSPGVEEYELEVEGSPEHEHVVMQLDFRVGARWHRIANGDEADVVQLVAAGLVVLGSGASRHGHVLQFQVSGTVDHLRKATKPERRCVYCSSHGADDTIFPSVPLNVEFTKYGSLPLSLSLSPTLPLPLSLSFRSVTEATCFV
jgi:hypothetical protein